MDKGAFKQERQFGELGNLFHTYFELDPYKLFNDSGAVGAIATGQPYGAVYDLRGDWLYVSEESTFVVRGDLFSQAGNDIASVALTPGKIIGAKFNRIRIFGTYGAAPQTGPTAVSGTPPNAHPVLRIFYGVGPCPFAAPLDSRGGHLDAFVSSTFAATTYNGFFRVEAATLLDASVQVAHQTGAAETSFLSASLDLFANDAVTILGSQAPTNVDRIAVSPAAAGFGYVFARWENVVVPRGIALVRINVTERGSAVTNTLTAAVTGAPPATLVLR
ncbi:MAG: hypothetical protein ACREUQ_07405 [Burkholderiales bacterium]